MAFIIALSVILSIWSYGRITSTYLVVVEAFICSLLGLLYIKKWYAIVACFGENSYFCKLVNVIM